jgi:hypothetical protein
MQKQLMNAAREKLERQYQISLPKTRGELDNLLNTLRPEGQDTHLWAGCRSAVSEALEIPMSDTLFQTWFTATVNQKA